MERVVVDNQSGTIYDQPPSGSSFSTVSDRASIIYLLFLSDDLTLSSKLGPDLGALLLEPRWVSSYEETINCGEDDWAPDVVVVVLLIPRAERYTICRVVKSHFGVPVIAVGEEPEMSRPGKLGADDYLGKPISPHSLATCVRDVLQREITYDGPIIVGDLIIDPKRNLVLAADQNVSVTSAELALLVRLARTPNAVVSKNELFRTIRRGATDLDQWLVDIHLTRLMVNLAEISSCRIARAPQDEGFMLSTLAKS